MNGDEERETEYEIMKSKSDIPTKSLQLPEFSVASSAQVFPSSPQTGPPSDQQLPTRSQ